MKYVFFFLFLGSFNLFAQSSLSPDSDSVDSDDNQIFTIVEKMPVPPGGMESLYKSLSRSIVYPTSARRNGEQGTAFVGFIVRKNGSITDVKTVKGVSPEINAEAERVVGLMPDWEPGTQNGKPVNVKYVLPIAFKLTAPKEPVLLIAEEMPEYPGGEKAMIKFIEKSIQYPADVEKGSVNKTVSVEFIVEKDGSLSEVAVNWSVSASLDAEAVRIVKTFPKWKPGKQGGKKVRVKVAVPIEFE